jgi:hypothetical protein
MAENAKAYLRTEGSVDYRDCKIAYYTYSMGSSPHIFSINVNVLIQHPNHQVKRTLAINDTFDNESNAINFGVTEGKKYIDRNYESGKIAILHPDDFKSLSKNDKYPPLQSKADQQKKDNKK